VGSYPTEVWWGDVSLSGGYGYEAEEGEEGDEGYGMLQICVLYSTIESWRRVQTQRFWTEQAIRHQQCFTHCLWEDWAALRDSLRDNLCLIHALNYETYQVRLTFLKGSIVCSIFYIKQLVYPPPSMYEDYDNHPADPPFRFAIHCGFRSDFVYFMLRFLVLY